MEITVEQLQLEIERLRLENEALKQDRAYGGLTRQGVEIEFDRRKDEAQYVIFLDLDYLHQINSQFNTYEPVDEMIRNAFSFRSDDLVFFGRWKSGDEMVFIVRTDPAKFIDRLQESLTTNGLSATCAAVKIENGDLNAAVNEGDRLVRIQKKARGIESR